MRTQYLLRDAGDTVSGGMVVCATSSGALSGTCKTSILNTATITASQSNVIELVYQSGASTSSINFTRRRLLWRGRESQWGMAGAICSGVKPSSARGKARCLKAYRWV